jgi:hypothetical protein
LALETRPFGDLRNLVSQGKLDVSPAAMDLLSQLRKPGSMVEVPKGFELRTLADMQRGAQVEFAAVRMQDGSRMLVRGNRFDVDIPEKCNASYSAYSPRNKSLRGAAQHNGRAHYRNPWATFLPCHY